MDDFVQTVLETKGALVNAVVEGEALAGDLSGSVLDELQRALRAISPGLADTPARIEDDGRDRAAAPGSVRRTAGGARIRARRGRCARDAPRTSTRSGAHSRRSRACCPDRR